MSTRRNVALGLAAVLVASLPLAAHAAPHHHGHHHHHKKKPTVAIADTTVTETNAAGVATLTLTLEHGRGKPVTVTWATVDGTAKAPGDYTASSGTVVFKGRARTQRQTIAVPVQGDTVHESTETFGVVLTGVQRARAADPSATVTVLDDDPVVTHKLTVTVAGSGSVTSSPAGIGCPGACSLSVVEGTAVKLTATAGSGSAFTGWSGACTGTGPTCVVTMGADHAVGASFAARLDYQQPAVYGEVNLAKGFTPDPYTIGAQAGGPVDVSYLGGSCKGYATSAPTLRLNYGGGGASLLRIYYKGVGDPVIVVNDPYGNYYCVDDSFGTVNPTLDFTNPAGGSYDIWVGSRTTFAIAGTIYLTGSSSNHP